MEQGCWCSLEGAYFPFITASLIRPLPEAGVEWWHNHFLSLDYGYGKSSSPPSGSMCAGPAEMRPSGSIPGVRMEQRDQKEFPTGRIRKNWANWSCPMCPAYQLAQMVVEAFLAPDEQGRPPVRIVAAYLDPANFKDIGDGHTIADQINEVLQPWDVVLASALPMTA